MGGCNKIEAELERADGMEEDDNAVAAEVFCFFIECPESEIVAISEALSSRVAHILRINLEQRR